MVLTHLHTLLASATSTLSPGGTPITLPGMSLLRALANDAAVVGAIIIVLIALGSRGMMAIGHRSGNGRLADRSRRVFIASIIVGIVAGSAWTFISFVATRL